MNNEVSIRVTAKNETRRVLGEVAAEFQQFSNKLTRQTQSFMALEKQRTQAMTDQWASFSRDWTQKAESYKSLEEQRQRAVREQWDKTKKTLATAGIALAAIGVAGKKAFEWAQEGAELDFTRTKFDRLARSIGTTGDVLRRDLRDAVSGTMSDMELMTSATDFLSLGLAKNHDEAVRLTRVAGQLGMNMNQLVLTLTNQTTMRFDALGVAVDGFKEKVKALEASGMDANAAFTEAFLQQAEAQIERVGDISETTAGKMRRLTSSFEDYIVQFKLFLAGMADGSEGVAGFFRVTTDLREAVDTGSVSMERARGIWLQYTTGIIDATGAAFKLRAEQNGLTLVQQTEADRLTALAKLYPQVGDAAEKTAEQTHDLTMAVEYAAREAESFDRAHLAQNIAKTGDNAAKAEPKVKSFLDGVDRSIASPIENFIKDLKWVQGTGGQFEEAFGKIKTAVDTGAITPEQGKKFSEQLLVGIYDAQEELDMIDADTAAQNISDTLGVSLQEAKDMINGTDGIAAVMDEFANTEYSINEQLKMSIEGVGAAIKGDDGSVWDLMQQLTDKPWTIDVQVKYHDPGWHPPKSGQNIGLNPGGGGRASGGPVLEGVSYMVGERGPEVFVAPMDGQIVSNQDMKMRPMGGGNVNVTNIFNIRNANDPYAIAQQVQLIFNQQVRNANNAGYGFSGS